MKDRIKELRKANSHGENQKTFADFLGISQSNLASYETGRRVPSDAVIQLICQKCNVNEEWLRTGRGEIYDAVSTDDFMEIAARIDIKDKKARQAIMDYWNLSDADKELFWNFIERFAKK